MKNLFISKAGLFIEYLKASPLVGKTTTFLFTLNPFKGVLLLFTPLIAVLAPLKTMLTLLALIIFIDFITGVRKSLFKAKISLNPFVKAFWTGAFWRKFIQTISSAGFRQTSRKCTEYLIMIICSAGLESIPKLSPMVDYFIKFVPFDTSLTVLVIGIFIVIEIYSIIENCEAVSGLNIIKTFNKLFGKKVPETLK